MSDDCLRAVTISFYTFNSTGREETVPIQTDPASLHDAILSGSRGRNGMKLKRETFQ